MLRTRSYLTDAGNAESFERLHGAIVRYVPAWGRDGHEPDPHGPSSHRASRPRSRECRRERLLETRG